jgi:hypothetical protein
MIRRMLSMRPQPSEFADYYAGYVGRVPDGQWRARLEAQADEYRALVAGLDDGAAGLPLAPGKWSVTQTLTHVADAERVFAFRLLWFARGDDAALPGFDQDKWMASLAGAPLSLADSLADVVAARQATVHMLKSVPDAFADRRGVASNNPITVRALAWIIVGHAQHHLDLLRDALGTLKSLPSRHSQNTPGSIRQRT